MKALVILQELKENPNRRFLDRTLSDAIAELEELEVIIEHSIEEIEWALVKPNYDEVYLNNALRYLKERT